MFYATVLQSVGQNGAVDVQGKRLSFIGYMQVQAGDTVWTDGRVIFGNVPPKDTPSIIAPPKGVPVLGDNLRGYINKTGNYKGYLIIQDNWIVNDDKNFKHGSEENLLDVEIFKSTAENKIPFVYKAGITNKNSVIDFYRDDSLVEQINLADFNTADNKAADYADSIVNSDFNRFKRISFATSYFERDKFKESYSDFLPKYELNNVQLLGLHIDDNCSCHAIVASWRSVSYRLLEHNILHDYKFFFTYEQNNYKVGDRSAEYYLNYYKEVSPSPIDLINDIFHRITDIDEYIYTYTYTDLGIEDSYSIPNSYSWYSKRDDVPRPAFTFYYYTLAYLKDWQMEKIIDHKYFQSFFAVTDATALEFSTTPSSRHLGKLGTSKSVVARSAAFHTTILLEDSEDTQEYYSQIEHSTFANSGTSEENIFNVFKFPLQDGYTADMTVWQVKAVYDKTGKKICGELPIQNNSAFMEDYSAYIDGEGNIDVNWSNKRKINADGSFENVEVGNSKADYNCGFFYYDDNGVKQNYFMPNISVTKLTETKYLIGFHGGNLYLSDNGEIKKLTAGENDKLKNFRLREMKNLNKAKERSIEK